MSQLKEESEVSEHSESEDSGISDANEDQPGTPPERKRVSVKDFAVLVTLATIAASGMVTAVFGFDSLVEKCTKLDLLDISIALLIFAVLIGTFTYILLRVAAHYIVYLGIGVLLHLVFPVNPKKARKQLHRVFNKDKKAN